MLHSPRLPLNMQQTGADGTIFPTEIFNISPGEVEPDYLLPPRWGEGKRRGFGKAAALP
jgi:hypothetical protein